MKRLLLSLLLLAPACAAGAAPQAAPLDAEGRALCEAAVARTEGFVRYDPSYVRLEYPNGDVPRDRGVCTDVVIRSYRDGLGVDLQRLVHEDMRADFAAYPDNWGLTRPDRNIDHRRVPNLRTFWRRRGAELAVSSDAEDYRPGDIVTWSVENRPHVGLVSDRKDPGSGRPLIVHNIGAGTVLEDMLFDWPITGHYRWRPAQAWAGSSGNSSR